MSHLKSLKLLVTATLVALALGACHGSSTFTQTFESQEAPGQTLTLSSGDGFLRSEAGFPHNVMDWLLGAEEVSGTYVLKNGAESTEGNFRLLKKGEERFLELTAPAKDPWELKVETGGLLVASDEAVWRLKDSKAKSVQGFQVGQ